MNFFFKYMYYQWYCVTNQVKWMLDYVEMERIKNAFYISLFTFYHIEKKTIKSIIYSYRKIHICFGMKRNTLDWFVRRLNCDNKFLFLRK